MNEKEQFGNERKKKLYNHHLCFLFIIFIIISLYFFLLSYIYFSYSVLVQRKVFYYILYFVHKWRRKGKPLNRLIICSLLLYASQRYQNGTQKHKTSIYLLVCIYLRWSAFKKRRVVVVVQNYWKKKEENDNPKKDIIKT